MRALNSSQETFPGISYTVAYTRLDETVQPNADDSGSSSLHGGGGRIANVAIQDICPNAPSEHLAIGTYDPVAHDLAMDALEHDGVADPARIDRLVCTRAMHPGVNPATFPQEAGAAAVSFETYEARQLPAEPALACYTTASCRRSDPGGGTSGGAGRACTSRRHFAVHFRGLRGARATLGGRPLKRRRRGGRLVGTVDLRPWGGGTVVLRVTGRDARGRRVTRTRRYHPCVERYGTRAR